MVHQDEAVFSIAMDHIHLHIGKQVVHIQANQKHLDAILGKYQVVKLRVVQIECVVAAKPHHSHDLAIRVFFSPSAFQKIFKGGFSHSKKHGSSIRQLEGDGYQRGADFKQVALTAKR